MGEAAPLGAMSTVPVGVNSALDMPREGGEAVLSPHAGPKIRLRPPDRWSRSRRHVSGWGQLSLYGKGASGEVWVYGSRKLIRPTGVGPGGGYVDQHCLVEPYSTGTGGTFTRRMDYVTVRVESLKGPGTVWVDYEIPGMIPRQVGPRGQFDTPHHAVGFTFPITQPPSGSSLVVYIGAPWSDGSTPKPTRARPSHGVWPDHRQRRG